MGLSWEEMCQKVVIDGRPGDVESAALGWEQLIKNLNNVKQSLDTNIKDLGTVWKGPAYEAFKGHVEQIAKDTGQIVADAEKGSGIVQSLKTAAEKLTAAQRDFPVPATCVNDVLEARNAKLTLSVGFFEAKVAPDFLGWLDPVTAVADWINDRSEEAAGVYQRVSGDYQNIAPGTPGDASGFDNKTPTTEIPKLDNGGGGGGGVGKVPDIGGKPSIGDMGAKPSIGSTGMPDTGNLPNGSGTHPDLSGGYDTGSGGYPGTGGVPGSEDYSSGLAGAGGGGTPGLGSGLGGGGLGGSSGLGSGGGGLGGGAGTGVLAGGGALGRAVSPGMGPMMGGGAAGAGRGGGRGGGRPGVGGKLGAGGGMAPGMGGVAGGGAGRGGAGRGAAGAGGRGAGGRGAGGMAGMGAGAGAGYGEEEAPRNSWLEEDEDVWGADGGGTSGVLR